MKTICCIILILIFLLISAIHFNWFIGGKWGLEESLPHDKEGKRVLNPKKIDILFVAFVLLFIALFYFNKAFTIFNISNKITAVAEIVLPFAFVLRAMGEFKYVGFFKKVKESRFAYLDTFYYSPLCLIISTLMLLVVFY